MKSADEILASLIVIVIRVTILIFAMRFIGFNPSQAVILTSAIVVAMEIQ